MPATFVGTIKITIDEDGCAVATSSIRDDISPDVANLIQAAAAALVVELNDLGG